MSNVYAEAGVDFEKEHDVVAVFTKLFEQTRKNVADLEEKGIRLPKKIGYFADGIDLVMAQLKNYSKRLRIVKGTDGAGTKPLVHQLYRIFGGNNPEALACVGVDAAAMSVNDLLCTGARCLMITDYVAWTNPDLNIARDLAAGLKVGADKARGLVIGGENASLSEMIKGVPIPGMDFYINGTALAFRQKGDDRVAAPEVLGNPGKYLVVRPGQGYDICTDAVGIITNLEVAKRLEGRSIRAGDIIIGLRSSGIHCNGISLARKKLINYAPMGWNGEFHPLAEIDEFKGKTALEEILTPTEIYSALQWPLEHANYMKGVVNITGEGVRNLHRLLGDRYGADLNFKDVEAPHAIFPMLQELGKVSTKEMYEDFNMGWGLYLVASKSKVDKVISWAKVYGFEGDVLGEVTNRKGLIRIKAYDGKEERYGE